MNVEIIPIEPNVDLVTVQNKEIYLVGTAHISKQSAEQVERLIKELKPDTVAVELCEPRYQSLQDPDRWKKTDIVSVIRSGKTYVLMAQLMLSGFQRKLGKQLNVKPGAEMMAAADTARALNIPLVMADREIRITLKRTWASLGFWGIFKLCLSMGTGLFSDEKIDEAEIERLKSADALNELMKEFSAKLPKVRTALIDERDQYLTEKIQSAPGKKIVAVVGAGHVPGMRSYFGKTIDLKPLEEIPSRSIGTRIVAWLIPILVIGMVVLGFFKSGENTSAEMIGMWFWINGLFAAIGTALAMGHPLSIMAAFFAAPFTALHPFLASGWASGLVEAMLRKPLVSDLENIADDIGSVKGIFKNRVSKILLVVALTNLTGTIGAIIGAGSIAALLKG